MPAFALEPEFELPLDELELPEDVDPEEIRLEVAGAAGLLEAWRLCLANATISNGLLALPKDIDAEARSAAVAAVLRLRARRSAASTWALDPTE